MHYKTKSILMAAFILTVMVGLGFAVNILDGGITGGGAVLRMACSDNSDCDDGMACTTDLCKNPGTENSLCLNTLIENCQEP